MIGVHPDEIKSGDGSIRSVKLFEVAADAGLHPRKVEARQDAQGVVPALAGAGRVATFYRRADLPLVRGLSCEQPCTARAEFAQ